MEDSVNPTCSQSPQSNKPIRLQTDAIALVISRILERIVVKDYIYPSLQHPPLCLAFDDQFAFQPTGSTTAVLIHLIHSITTLLDTNPFVVVLALDFSKAFDSVRPWKVRVYEYSR